MFLSHSGRPVDIHGDLNYVPSVFACTKQPESEASAHQKQCIAGKNTNVPKLQKNVPQPSFW